MEEKNKIIESARKYYRALKEVSPEMVDDIFLPQARKEGFMFDYDNGRFMDLQSHSRSEIRNWAAEYNRERIMPDIEVETQILYYYTKTAVVVLKPEWADGMHGLNYITLGKIDGEWKIANIFRQSLA